MANTFELIASSTVTGATAASIDFTSIPSTYTDLVVNFSTRDNGGGTFNNIQITFNGSTSGYSDRLLYGTGSSALSAANTSGSSILLTYSTQAGATASTFSNGNLYIPNYKGSQNKSVSIDDVTENNATSAIAALTAGLWSNSAAINRVTLTPNGGQSFVQYSSAYLYGIKNS